MRTIGHWVRFFIALTEYDLLSTVILGNSFGIVCYAYLAKNFGFNSLAGWENNAVGILLHFVQRLGLSVVYTFLFVSMFNLVNQITGIEEDKINKPSRPLPQKMLSIPEAWSLLKLMIMLFNLYAMLLDQLVWSLAWTALSFAYCYILSYSYWTKNLVGMSLGFYFLVFPCCAIMDTRKLLVGTPAFHNWLTCLIICVGIGSNVQDIRDTKGDLMMKRKTLSVAFGASIGRLITGSCLIAAQLFFHVFCIQDKSQVLLSWLLSIGYGSCLFYIAYKVFTGSSSEEFGVCYTLYVASTVVFLPLSMLVIAGNNSVVEQSIESN